MDVAADGEQPQPGINFLPKIALLVNAADVAHDLVERVPQQLDQKMVMVRKELASLGKKEFYRTQHINDNCMHMKIHFREQKVQGGFLIFMQEAELA